MTKFTFSTLSAYVPAAGHITICDTYRNARLVNRYVQFRDPSSGVVSDEVTVSPDVSRVDVLTAIYHKGSAISGTRKSIRDAASPRTAVWFDQKSDKFSWTWE